MDDLGLTAPTYVDAHTGGQCCLAMRSSGTLFYDTSDEADRLTPVVVALSRWRRPRSIAKHLNAPVHGREGRVATADAFSPMRLIIFVICLRPEHHRWVAHPGF